MRSISLLGTILFGLLISVGLHAGTTAAAETGKAVYDKNCAACHAAGIAGAPKLGDKDAWQPLLDRGIDQMTAAVISGKGVMPPKGGNASLSEDDIRAAVKYMADQSR